MLYLLYGPDTYRREERLSEIRGAYRKKNPQALGETVIDGDEDFERIREVFAEGGGLFEQKRFVIVRDAFAVHGEELIEFLDGSTIVQRDDLNIVFTEGDVEKKKQFAEFKKLCRTEAFPKLSEARVKEWIRSYVRAHGFAGGPKSIDAGAVTFLARLGSDLWRLAHELEKLIAYAAGRETVVEADVEALVRFAVEETIFPLSDGVCEREPEKALVALARLTAEEENVDGLLGYVIRETRNLVRARYALSEGGGADGAKTFQVKPFVWRKRISQARRWDEHEMPALLARAADLDLAWKTGAHKRLALERFILSTSA